MRNDSRSVSSKSGKFCWTGTDAARLRRNSHCPANCSTNDVEAIVGDHPPHLALEDRGIAQLPLLRQAQQLLVRDAAPQEERQTRRELDVADPIWRVRRDASGIGFDAQQELRADEQTLQRLIDPLVEAARRGAVAVERHQRLDVGGRHRTTIGAASESAENRSRARVGVAISGGSAAALLGVGSWSLGVDAFAAVGDGWHVKIR